MTALEFVELNPGLSKEELMIEFAKRTLDKAKTAIFKAYQRKYDLDRGEYFNEVDVENAYPQENIK